MSEKRGMQTNTHQLHLDLDILHSLYIIGGNPEDLLLSDTYFFTYISFIVSVLILFVFQKQTIYSCFCSLLCDWYFKFCWLYFKDIYSKHHLIHTVFLLFSLPLVSPEQSFTVSYFPHVKCVFAAVNILSSLFLCGLAPSTPQSTSWRSNWSPTTPATSTSRRTLPLLR